MAAALLLLFISAAGCAGTRANAPPPEDAALSGSSYEAVWGIRVKSVMTTAQGHMLDLRYEVTDPDKAAPVLDRDAKPYLVHKRTGKSLVVPNMAKVGPLQQTSNPPVTGVVYFMLFGNDGLAKPGDEVKLVVGEAVFDGLVVQ